MLILHKEILVFLRSNYNLDDQTQAYLCTAAAHTGVTSSAVNRDWILYTNQESMCGRLAAFLYDRIIQGESLAIQNAASTLLHA